MWLAKKHPNLRLDTIFKHSFIKVLGVKAQEDTLNLNEQKVPCTNISVQIGEHQFSKKLPNSDVRCLGLTKTGSEMFLCERVGERSCEKLLKVLKLCHHWWVDTSSFIYTRKQ